MNIPQQIILNRNIISLDVYKYHQSLAKKLFQKRKYLESVSSKKIISNYTKSKILKWFSNLNVQNRIKICSIYNNWLTNILFQMITYVKYDSVVEFSPTEIYDEFAKNKTNILLNQFAEYKEFLIKERYRDKEKFKDFFMFFKGENNVKKRRGSPDINELKDINYKRYRENEFMKEIRFITLDVLNDTLTLSYDLINKPERMMEYFNFFSNNQCFNSTIIPIQENNKSFNFTLPNWIYDYNSYSLYQLIIIFFEQIISIYYQLYLVENEIPQFDIDKKYSYFFQTNLNTEEYLKKNINEEKNINEIINKQNIYNILKTDNQKNLIQYYEKKTEIVYFYAFYSKYYNDTYNYDTEINKLIELYHKNIHDFVNKISFIESKEAFLYPNFIYSIVYQQLSDQYLNQYCRELITEEENNKINDKNIKFKKNKKKKNKKRQINIKEQSNNFNIDNNKYVNIDINDEIKIIEEEKKENNTYDNEEEEIEEIPSKIIDEPKTEIIEPELSNNMASNNDINNSTVSSSYTNRCSKDLNSLGTKYNNFVRGDKKEEETYIKIEMEDLSDEKSEDAEKENEKFKLEDISENDISEETLFNEEIVININNNENNNKKKKKKNKKRNKKKKSTINNTNNENENEIKNNKDNKEIIKVNKSEEKNKNKDNKDVKIIDIKNEKIENKKIQIKKENKDIKEENKKKEEKEVKLYNMVEDNKEKINMNENNNKDKEIIEENVCKKDINEENNSQNDKKKKNKEFFLFPVYNSNKKKGNKKQAKNKEKNNLKKDSNESNTLNNKDINNLRLVGGVNDNKKDNIPEKEELLNIKDENLNKKNLLIKINEAKIEFCADKDRNKEKTISNEKEIKNTNKILIEEKEDKYKNNIFDIKKETDLQINSIKSAQLQNKEEYHISNEYNSNKYNDNYINNLYYMDQIEYSNVNLYANCNDSLYNFQNEIFINIDKEILNYEKNVDNNLKELKVYREQIIRTIKDFISKTLNVNYEFEFLFYGSYSTGLSIESSDIDILIKFRIINNIYKSSPEQNIENIISLLEKALNQNKDKLNVNKINPIYTASVPVIKIECDLKSIIPKDIQNKINEKYIFNFENEILKLNIDFTFNEINNINEEKNIPSQEIITYIKDKINIYPNIRPLLLVLKRYMQIKKLNSSFHGGISSYSLFLLLYAYILQNYKDDDNNINYIKEYLSMSLFGFYSFYSNLDFEIYTIDVKKSNPFHSSEDVHQNSILLIDPITGLNVAKSTFRIEQIKYVFNNAIMVLNNIFYEKMNNIKRNDNYNILDELFTPYNYNNIFISDDSSSI